MSYLGTKPANQVIDSTLIADGAVGTNDIADSAVTASKIAPSAQYTGFKNRLINGDFRIDQRNNGASVGTSGASGGYSLDRWQSTYTQASKFTVQQNAGSVTPPVGFTNYLGVTSSSAYSVGSGDTFLIQQSIEGFNVADLGWGTANAQTVTLSFWVRSSLTGAFGGALVNGNATRSYSFSYTISAANTWEYKTITIAGDTTGTWLTNNGLGIGVRFGLGSGSTFTATAGSWQAGNFVQPTGGVSVVGTNGATLYITGVQLEKGSTATSFDYRPYTTELQLAQRYYWRIQGETSTLGYSAVGTGTSITSTGCFMVQKTPVRMRASPTLSFNGTVATYPGGNMSAIANTYSSTNNDVIFAQLTTSSLSGAGQSVTVYTFNATNNWFDASAEL